MTFYDLSLDDEGDVQVHPVAHGKAPEAGSRCYLCHLPRCDRRLRGGHAVCGPCERDVQHLVERRIRRARAGW